MRACRWTRAPDGRSTCTPRSSFRTEDDVRYIWPHRLVVKQKATLSTGSPGPGRSMALATARSILAAQSQGADGVGWPAAVIAAPVRIRIPSRNASHLVGAAGSQYVRSAAARATDVCTSCVSNPILHQHPREVRAHPTKRDGALRVRGDFGDSQTTQRQGSWWRRSANH